MPAAYVGRLDRIEVPAAQQVGPGVQPLRRDRTARRDDTHPVAGDQPPGAVPGDGGTGTCHFVSSSGGTSVRAMPKVCAYSDSSASTARTMVSARRKPWPSPSKAR